MTQLVGQQVSLVWSDTNSGVLHDERKAGLGAFTFVRYALSFQVNSCAQLQPSKIAVLRCEWRKNALSPSCSGQCQSQRIWPFRPVRAVCSFLERFGDHALLVVAQIVDLSQLRHAKQEETFDPVPFQLRSVNLSNKTGTIQIPRPGFLAQTSTLKPSSSPSHLVICVILGNYWNPRKSVFQTRFARSYLFTVPPIGIDGFLDTLPLLGRQLFHGR